MTTQKFRTQAELETVIHVELTAAQVAKLAALEPLGWKISSSTTNGHDETGVFIIHPDGRYALCPPTAYAKLLVAAKKTNKIYYNLLTWERM